MTIRTREAEIEFEKELSSIDWNNETYDINASPEDAYNDLTWQINKLKEKHFPTVTKRFNKYKHKKNSWITQGILWSIRFRDKLYRRVHATKPKHQLFETLVNTLKQYNTILQKAY
jgi:hypothetical protein